MPHGCARCAAGPALWRAIVTTPIRFPLRFAHLRWAAGRTALCAMALVAGLGLSGCVERADASGWASFVAWQQDARRQALDGMLHWSALYQQSFDRLTALPPSMAQDTYLENTVLLLSVARKYEAREMDAQQFAQAREQIERQLAARLR